VAYQRGAYPYALSLEEGGFFCSMQRILNLQQLYSEPTLNWIPSTHPPLYTYLTAGVASLVGNDFFALRLIAIFSTLALGYIFFRFLISTGVEDVFAFAGFGLFIAGFNILGGYYDLAQTDTLSALLALLVFLISASGREMSKAVLSGIFIALAFFTKAEYMLVWLLLLVHWILTDRKGAFFYAVTSLSLILAGLALLDLLSGGWSGFYLLKAPLHPVLVKRKIIEFWNVDLFRHFPLLCLISLIGLYGLLRGVLKKARKISDSVMAVFILGMMGIAFFECSQPASCEISALPAFLCIIALTVWTIQHFHLFEYGLGYLLPVSIKLLTVIQFAILLYNPQMLTPKKADAEAGDRVVSTIKGISEAVYLPNCGYLNLMAGKEMFAHWTAIGELKNVSQGLYYRKMVSALDSALDEGYFRAVIAEQPLDRTFSAKLLNYRFEEKLFRDNQWFWSKAGNRMRPQYIYMRK
jgi:hypothetical protein